jgi:glycosyltransferase involved in cell wall biosynthesis
MTSMLKTGLCQMSTAIVDASCYSLPYDRSLCLALSEAGCEVMLARSKFPYELQERSEPFLTWDGFYSLTHRLGVPPARRRIRMLLKGAEHLISMKRFSEVLRRRKPDVIHFQWLPVPLLDRLCLPKLRSIAPLVLTLHNTKFSRGGWGVHLQQGLGVDSIFEYFDAVIVHSEFSRRQVIENGWMPAKKVHVIQHGPLEFYRAFAEAKQPRAEEELVLLFFGAIEHYKGLDVLLRAFAELPAELIQATRLVIAGQPGRTSQTHQGLARQLGIDHRLTWILRFIREEEVPHLFQSATAVVLPYREVDQSGVLMTAIAFDKPIVASRVGGMPETVKDGVHGYLVSPGDVRELSEALRKILSQPEQRRTMAQELQRLRTGPLSWSRSADRTIEVYQSILKAPKLASVERSPARSSAHDAGSIPSVTR